MRPRLQERCAATLTGKTMAERKATTGNGDAMRVDPHLVRELAALLTEAELTEIEVQDGDRRIKVTREPAPIIGHATPTAAPAAAAPAPAAAAASESPAEEISGQTVKSPMVGTAYL